MANYFSTSFKHHNTFFSNTHHHCREYVPSYPSITRYHSSSPYRKLHYLDDSDEEIIKDEIIEMIEYNHYPTFDERWGEDTKSRMREEGELKIEDYVEFDEIEPTITEEISYEITYEGDQIKSTREIHHSRSESRNFRKIRKRRTKRKRTKPLINNDLSGETINTTQFHQTLPYDTRSANISLIDDHISSQTFASDDQKRILYELIEQEGNQSNISSDDVISRRKSSINESNDKQSNKSENEIQLKSIDSEIKQEETIEVPVFSQLLQSEDSIEILTTSPSLDSIVETNSLPVLSRSHDSPVQYTNEDAKSSAANIISTTVEPEQKATVSSDLPATSINIHLPSSEIKTETVYTEESNDVKSSTNLTTTVDKQPETISIPTSLMITPEEEELSQQTYSTKNESITSNTVNGITETVLFDQKQPLISSKNEEDEHVELSSDFLADIVRQIRTTTTRLRSINDSRAETTDQPSIISTPTINIEDNERSESSNTVQRTTSKDLPSDVLNEATPSSMQSISHVNQSPSSTPDMNAQTSSKSSVRDNISHQLELLSNPVVHESSSSISELRNTTNSILTIPSKPSITSETDFIDLYPDHYVPFTANEQTFLNFIPIEIEQSDEKKTTSDLTKIYYELREQRHIQPVHDNILTEQKQETSDINLNNQIRHFDIKSFSITTNLPSREYRQVFGAPDEIIDTVDDLTYNLDQTVQSDVSNEKSQVRESSEDYQSIVPTVKEELVNEVTSSSTSNAELDLRYSLLIDRMDAFLKPLMDLSSSSFVTETESIPPNIAEEKDLSDQTKSSHSISSEELTANIDEHQEVINSSNLVDHIKSLATTVISNFTNVLSTTESIVDTFEVPVPVVTNEEIKTKEVDEQQQPSSSTGLLEIVKNIIPSALLSKTPAETSLENVQPIVTAEQQYGTVEECAADVNISSTNTSQQASLQASTTNEEQPHGVLDLVVSAISNVKETISHLVVSNEKTAASMNVSEESNDTTQGLKDLDNDNEQQAAIDTGKEISDKSEEQSVPCQPITSNDPWFSSQYKVTATEFDRLSSTHESSSTDEKQEDNNEKKPPSSEQLQMINDDYPWYSSYYSIVDAEAKFAQLYKQLHPFSEQPPLPTMVEFKNEPFEKVTNQNNYLQEEQDNDDDSFHIVQRRKRIPSSTTQDKTVSSTILTAKPALGPDIDLEPVVLHGHPDAPISVSSIVSPTTETSLKKKQKKKKKDKKEVILFDAPEPTSSPDIESKIESTSSPTVTEEQHQENIEMNDSVIMDQTLKHEEEQLQSIPTVIADDRKLEVISNAEELERVDDKANESTSSTIHESSTIDQKQEDENEKKPPSSEQLQMINDDYPWYSSYFSIIDAEAKFAQLYKQLHPFSEQSPLPTTVELPDNAFEKVTLQHYESQQEENNDDDGFHIVQRRERIPSSTTQDKTVPSTIITAKLDVSPDIDLEPVVLHGHPDAPISVSSIAPQTTETSSKKKQKKKKKDKREVILFDALEPTSSPRIESKIDFTACPIVAAEEQLRSVPTVISDDQKPQMISDEEELVKVDDKTNELTSSNASPLLTSPAAMPRKDVQAGTQLIEQQPAETESIVQSLGSPIQTTTKTIQTSTTLSAKEEGEDDNDGFHLVRYRGRILSAAKSEQSPPSTPTSKEILNPNVDEKLPISSEDHSLPISQKKRNKHKKQKKEVDSSSTIDSSQIEQETVLWSHVSSSSISEDMNEHSFSILPPTVITTTIHLKPSASPKEDDEEDNEGFRLVTYRKRIASASRFVNIPSSPSTKNREERNTNRNNNHRRVILHGRHGSASPSIPRTILNTKISSNQNIHIRPKHDKKQSALFHTPPRSISAETSVITSMNTSNASRIPKDIKPETGQSSPTALDEHQQRDKDSKGESIVSLMPQLDEASPKKQPVEQIVQEHQASTKEEIKTIDHSSSIKKTPSSTAANTSSSDIEKSTSTEVKNDSSSSAPAPESVVSQDTTKNKKVKKQKLSKEPITTDTDFVPLSVEETPDRKATVDTQQASELEITSANNFTNSQGTSLANTASETITSPIIESINQTNDDESQMHSIQLMASTTSATEEVSKTSTDLSNQIDDHLITNQTEKEELIKEIPPTISIESTVNTQDEHAKTASSKKRRKKKSHTKEKPDGGNVSASSTNAAALTPMKTESRIPQAHAVQQESNATGTTMALSFNSPSHASKITSEAVINKLDLFLPDYIRQQINTPPTTTSTSSDLIPKKKPRSKMLKKDHEVMSLFTNEFDNTADMKKQDALQITSLDDELPAQSTLPSTSTESTVDNILSRGFYLWLQESQALSQQTGNRTNIMQSIVIQPSTTTDEDEDEDSWNTSKSIKSTYIIGIHPEKRIHLAHAYSINHPELTSTPSWLIAQSDENTFQDKPKKSDPENDDDSSSSINGQSSKQSNSNNIIHQTRNFTTYDVQQCLGEDFYRQINQNSTINFDDWAHFLEDKTTYHIGDQLSPSLECFYTRPFDEDTLLSDAIPIHHSIKNEQQRYGDFLSSNKNESTAKLPLCKAKPSEYFQNWRRQESISNIQEQNDDEILISHSNDGLSRRVRP